MRAYHRPGPGLFHLAQGLLLDRGDVRQHRIGRQMRADLGQRALKHGRGHADQGQFRVFAGRGQALGRERQIRARDVQPGSGGLGAEHGPHAPARAHQHGLTRRNGRSRLFFGMDGVHARRLQMSQNWGKDLRTTEGSSRRVSMRRPGSCRPSRARDMAMR